MKEIEKILLQYKPLINKAIAKSIPREFKGKELERIAGKPAYAYDEHSLTKSIATPIWDLLDRGGKRLRPALTLLVIEALGKNPRKFVDFAVIPEVIHNGCITGDSLVWMADGTPKTIPEIQIGDKVLSIEDDCKLAKKKVEYIHDNGVKETYRVRTKNRDLRVTA